MSLGLWLGYVATGTGFVVMGCAVVAVGVLVGVEVRDWVARRHGPGSLSPRYLNRAGAGAREAAPTRPPWWDMPSFNKTGRPSQQRGFALLDHRNDRDAFREAMRHADH